MTVPITIVDATPNDTITVIDGPPANGSHTIRLVIHGGSFPIDITNIPAVTIDGGNNNDNVFLDNPDPATGLQSLTIQNLGGTGSITGSNPKSNSPDIAVATLNLTAPTNIGSGSHPLQTQTSTLSATAGTAAAGNISITNGVAAPQTLNIANLSATNASGGTITLTNNGTINDTGSGITATGIINITTTGATANFNIGSGGGISSILSAVNLTVGGDLNLGDSAGTGNILADNGVNASAGGNITLNANATINNGSGNITLTAGGNFTMLTAPGNQNNSPAITDFTGGTILLSAGKGHTLTVDSSGGTAISASPGGAAIVLIADAMFINKGITATAANRVTFTTATPGQGISLGAANAPGVLGLTQTELNQVTAAGVVQIGSPTAGNITIASPIATPSGTGVLSLINNGSISQNPFGSLTAGNLRVSSTGPVTLTNASNNIGTFAASTTNGLSLTDGTHALTIGTVDGVAGIATTNSAVGLTADTISITGAAPINAGTGIVTLAPTTATLAVTLGQASIAGTSFGLTDAELGDITASVLRVNAFGVGANSLAISGAVTRHAGYNTLSLTTPGGISQSAALAVASLALDSGSGIALTNSGNSVDNLAFTNFSNAVNFTNTGTNGLTIGAVDGIASSSNIGGGTTISTGGNLTVAAGLSSTGGGTVLTSTNGQILDGGNGTIVDVTTPTLTLSASTGIGAATDPLETQVATLNGATTSTGGIFISNGTAGNATPATLAIGSSGVQVTGATGDIVLFNNGTIDSLTSTGVVTAPGNITVKALGANGDLNVGNSSTIPIFGGGLVDVEAGRDINLGNSAGIGAVFSSAGSIKVVAGRNLTMNANGAVAVVSGTGGIAVTAGGNITMTTATGTNANAPLFLTQGGPIALTTGVGGTLTLASKAANSITSTNGNVTLTADNMIFNQGVNAGTGNVLLQPVTVGQQINLGTATGGLNLTSLELKQVTAQTLTIGNASAGQVTVSGNIGQGGVGAINLTNGGSGFTSAPGVNVTGGGGTGATAVATEQGGVVTGVQVTAQGQGYTSTPTISFIGGGGSGAAGAAVLTGPLAVSNLTINTGSNFIGSGATLNVGTGTLTIGFGENGLGDTENLVGAAITAGTFNVIGGAGNDSFVVGPGNENINGGGGGGLDTVFFPGTKAQYTITTAANGLVTVADTVAGRNGTNQLTGITFLAFNDQTVKIAPVPPTGLTLSPASDSGIKGDNITDVRTPTITGLGIAGEPVTLFDGSTVVGGTTVAANGTWSITTSPLAPGAHSLSATQSDNGTDESGASVALNLSIVQSPAISDFNGDGTSDMLVRAGSALAVYDFGGGTVTGSQSLGPLGTENLIAGFGNFNGNGTSDMLTRSTNSGALQVFDFSGGNVTGSQNLGPIGAEESIVGIGDFNGDGTSDMLVRDTMTNALQVFDLNNGTVSGVHNVTNGPDSTWTIVGVGDFNGDGTSDILVQNAASDLRVYDFSNNNITGFQDLGGIGNQFSIVGTGDFFGNGTSDLLVRAGTDLRMFDFKGGLVTGFQDLGALGSENAIVGLGDYNGDGTSDMLTRSTISGAFQVFDFSGGAVSNIQNIGPIGNEFSVIPDNSAILIHGV